MSSLNDGVKVHGKMGQIVTRMKRQKKHKKSGLERIKTAIIIK